MRSRVGTIVLSLIMTGPVLSATVMADEVVAAGQGNEEGVRDSRSVRNRYQDAGYARVTRRDWSPPRSNRIYRSPTEFSRMYPRHWYGQPGPTPVGGARRYPVILQPTDTTQHGYYLMQVPAWRPDPSRLPPVPLPSSWHSRPGGRYAAPRQPGPPPNVAPCLPPAVAARPM